MEKNIFTQIVRYAESCDKIKAVILFGSQARAVNSADKYSDYDLIFFVEDTDYFLNDNGWLMDVDRYYISFVEPTAAGGMERRVFFDNAMDVDMAFFSAEDAELVCSDEAIQSWLSRGCRIVVDKMELSELLTGVEQCFEQKHIMSEPEYVNLVNTFWFHTIWSIKKILRGEIWSGKTCIDGYLKELLRQMLELNALAKNGMDYEVWHDGRFFDQWAADDVIAGLGNSYGGYDADSLIKALDNTMHMFEKAAWDTASELKYTYPSGAQNYAHEQVERLKSNIFA